MVLKKKAKRKFRFFLFILFFKAGVDVYVLFFSYFVGFEMIKAKRKFKVFFILFFKAEVDMFFF